MTHKGVLQIPDLRLVIRPFLQITTTAIVGLGLLGGWAGSNWLTVSVIFAVMIAAIIWIGRQARPRGAKPAHIYASAVVNLTASAAIVLITGGVHSQFWLLFLVGAIASAMSFRGTAGANLERLNMLVAALALLAPGLIDRSINGPDLALAGIQVTTLVMSGMMIRKTTTLILEDEEKVRASEERYRKLIDHARDVIFTLAPDKTFTSLSPSFEALTGWSRAEWLGRSFEDLLIQEDQNRARDQFNRILLGETLRALRLRIHTYSGDVMVVEMNISPLIRNDFVVGLLGIARDMTEEQRAQDALAASERRFRAVVEKGWDAFTIADAQGTILYASPSTVRVLGYTPEEFVGVNAFSLFHPDDQTLARDKLMEVLQAPGSVVTAQVRIRHKDGSWRWIEGVVSNLFEEPDVRALITNYRDITERRDAEESLRESEQKLRDLFEMAQRQTQELALLDKVRTAMAEELELPVLLSRIVESIAETFGYTQVSLYLLQGEELVLQHEVGYAEAMDKIPLTRGITGRVARTGEAVWLEDVSSDPEFLEATEDVASEICVPLFDKGTVAGILNVESTHRVKLTEADLKLMNALSQHVGMAIARARLYGDVQRQNRILSALQESTLAVMKQLELSETLQAIISQAAQLANTEHGYIYLVQPDENIMEMIHGIGEFSENEFKGIKLKPGEGLAGKVWQSALPLIVQNYQDWSGRSPQFAGTAFHAVVGIPLTYGLRTIGVLGLAHLDPERQFSDGEVDLLSRFANLASIALENARLYTQVQQELEERKRAERVLHESEERFSKAFRSSPVALTISRVDDGRYIDVNLAWSQLLDFSREEALGGSSVELGILDPEGRQRIMDELQAKGSIRNTEEIIKDRSGEQHNVLFSMEPMKIDQEQYIVTTMIDITQRKRAEQGLRESQSRLAGIVKSAMDAIISVDADQKIVLVNPAAEQIFGYTQAELIGQPLDKLIPQRLWDIHRRQIEEFAKTGATTRTMYALGQVRGVRADGKEFPIEASISQIELENQKLFTVILRDITNRVQAEEQINRQLQRLRALHEIDLTITSGLEIHSSLGLLLEKVISHLSVDAAAILLLDPTMRWLQYAAGRGFQSRAFQYTQLPVAMNRLGRAVLEHRALHLSDRTKTPDELTHALHLEKEGFISYYGAPLVAKGQVKGVLLIFQRTPLDPDSEWLGFLETLAGQAAIAIEDAQLLSDLQRSNMELGLAYEATIEGWSRAMDLRDKETEGHTIRVTELTVQLARSMGIAETDIVHMRRGSLLHDIGKLGVPDSILGKPDQLTEHEMQIMQQHPRFAYDMLASILYLKPALDIPYCHHEKWDGTGYPRGLKGEQIPLAARMFAVVDVWDALRSDRPYRPKWPEEQVLEYIRAETGKYFDPDVVDAFLEMLGKK